MPPPLPAPPATLSDPRKLISLLLIPASVALIAARAALDVPAPVGDPRLLAALNIAFLTIIPLYIAYTSLVSFRFGGAVSTLLLGAGMLFVGLGTLATAIAQLFPGTANLSVTIYNITACLGMALSLAGPLAALAVWREPSAERRDPLAGTAYGAVVAVTAAVVLAALAGLFPAFFVPGVGSTLVRDLVLAAAIQSALLASVLFFVLARRRGEDFFFWYGVGLALFGVGLVTVAFIGVFGGLLNLAGRFEQYVGACYLLGAFLLLQRRAASRNVTVRELLTSFFTEAEAGYRQLVETAGDAIVVLGPDDRVLLWNTAAERMFGFSADEAVDLRFPDLVLGGAPLPLPLPPGNPSPTHRELEARRRDGGRFPVALTASSRTVEGQPITTLIVRDLSEQKRAEAALKQSEERQAFLLALNDALAPLADPVEVQAAAARVLGEHLGADWVAYFEVDGDEYVIDRDHARSVPSMAGRYPVASFGPRLLAAYRAGRTAVATDTALDPALSPEERAAFASVGARAYVGVPLVKAGAFVAGLGVNAGAPRAWTPAEVALVEETAGRTWAAVARARAEAALREREQALRSIFRAAPVGIGICSHHRITSVNDGFCRMTGYAEEEVVGRPTRMLHASDEEYDAVMNEKFAQIAEQGIGVVETRWRTGDGTVIPVLLSSSPMDPADPHESVVTIALDLSDLREREAALRESEAQYRNLVELSPDAILIHQDGAIVFANAAAAALVGAGEPGALVGRPIVGVVHPDMRSRVAANIAMDLRGEITPLTALDLSRDDGTTVPVQGRGSAIPFGGRPAVQVVLRDVTEERRAAEALAESEAKYRSLFDSLDAGFCIIEVLFVEAGTPIDYVVLEANPAFVQQTGLADAIGRRMRDLEPAHEEHWFQIYGEIARTGEPRRCVQAAMPLIGGWYEVYAFPSGAPGSNRVAILFHDITERMRSEEALREYAENLRRSNEDLERFAYVSSHDLQEPLRSIVSFSQLLERKYRGRLDAEADEYIDFIVEGGTRMQRLILDLLAFSRVNTTRQQIARTDAEDVLSEAMRSLDVSLREAGAVLTHDPLPDVTADPIQLAQVFENLVSNAVKFRRPNEPLRIHISARRLDGFWEFSVADNGIGIEAEYFEKIFVIFQRLHTKDAYPGTGIGLAIVKRIIDRHGGAVRVESTPGEGSTFSFTLPAA